MLKHTTADLIWESGPEERNLKLVSGGVSVQRRILNLVLPLKVSESEEIVGSEGLSANAWLCPTAIHRKQRVRLMLQGLRQHANRVRHARTRTKQ
ncbi:MAG: hypothetical protein MI924_02250 [Chloroflexales bacterium]|nr:hypothetical protein [Chloroflexales bacterium]